MTGVIVAKFVEAGDLATPGAPLFAVEQQDPLEVEVALSQSDLPFIRLGQHVELSVAGVGTQVGAAQLSGRVAAIVPAADPRTRTVTVKLSLPNPAGEMASGLFSRARFRRGDRRALLVPRRALVTEGQLTGVYVVSESRAHLRWLRTGEEHGGGTEVLSGLEEGELVILLAATDVIRDGDLVEGRVHAD